jgi:dihydroxyacetone kinase-like predicted kinase
MSTAAGAVREGVVSTNGAGHLGQVQGEPAVAGSDLLAVVSEVVDRMLAGGGELVTLVAGDGIDAEVLAALGALVSAAHPEVEVVALLGGQLRETVLVGVE